MKALLLAGGLGTRLRPLTENLPKPMLPVANRPWLEHLILHLKQQGISEFVITAKYHGEKIKAHFGDGHALGVRIQYAHEPTLLGTAGAIKNAEHLLDDRFIVLNADIIHPVQLLPLLEFHKSHGGVATIGLTEVDDPSQYGVVQQSYSGEILRFVEKPPRHLAPSNRVNAGIYVLEKKALKYIPKGKETSIERETFPLLIRRQLGVYGSSIHGYWMDMGTPERYLQVHWDVLDGMCALPLPVSASRPQVWLGRSQIAPTARVIPPVLIGDGVTIEGNCTVGPYVVLGNHVRVRAGSHLQHTVVWPFTEVQAGTQVSHSVLARDVSVSVAAPEVVEEVVMQ
ncbi:NDP-sugar synthase [Alicyclobacillus cycloheptanicus]|uniref:Mannose-1-phosphate guanylyltransferase n=1 Tax=Alicyclobacillus cycloheptanicus TaxID=1457 RepID=A0ABT9XFE3_9BACL|nr:NDP-sugar synthase [Alicyclobacillus cycloheptanicus]MDQ0188912.1 mannose-1-phosphate guanylyltransferase [Alicyclobacillus cycloheptanicus]WDM01737.1 NDP-sugar synthase [Alicyclobacillus cycloheptanicus]